MAGFTHHAKGISARTMLNIMRTSMMPQRADWNAMGPRLPGWFLSQLRRVARDLVLQFIPPSSHAPGGCEPTIYPYGVWAICRKLRGSGFLHSRWVMRMADSNGNPIQPTRDMINMLIIARDKWRSGRLDDLEREFDAQVQRRKIEAHRQSRARMMERIEGRMRREGMTDRPDRPMVSLAGVS